MQLRSLLATLPLVLACSAPAQAKLPFGPGEECVFRVGYGVVDAGEATLSIEDELEYYGSRVFHIRTRARSNRFFSAFFRVRDQADSYIDADSLPPGLDEDVIRVSLRPPWMARLADHGRAVADALAQVPDANVLVGANVSVRVEQYLLFQRICARVRGDAGRIR